MPGYKITFRKDGKEATEIDHFDSQAAATSYAKVVYGDSFISVVRESRGNWKPELAKRTPTRRKRMPIELASKNSRLAELVAAILRP